MSFRGKKTAEDESAGLSKQYNINRNGIFPAEQTSQSILNLNSLKRKFRYKIAVPNKYIFILYVKVDYWRENGYLLIYSSPKVKFSRTFVRVEGKD